MVGNISRRQLFGTAGRSIAALALSGLSSPVASSAAEETYYKSLSEDIADIILGWTGTDGGFTRVTIVAGSPRHFAVHQGLAAEGSLSFYMMVRLYDHLSDGSDAGIAAAAKKELEDESIISQGSFPSLEELQLGRTAALAHSMFSPVIGYFFEPMKMEDGELKTDKEGRFYRVSRTLTDYSRVGGKKQRTFSDSLIGVYNNDTFLPLETQINMLPPTDVISFDPLRVIPPEDFVTMLDPSLALPSVRGYVRIEEIVRRYGAGDPHLDSIVLDDQGKKIQIYFRPEGMMMQIGKFTLRMKEFGPDAPYSGVVTQLLASEKFRYVSVGDLIPNQ